MVRSKGSAKRKQLADGGAPGDEAAGDDKRVKRGEAATPASEKDDDGQDPRRVYASRLPESWGDDELRRSFEAFGAVAKASVVRDHDERSRGFGFVVFEAEAGKAAALAAGYVRGREPRSPAAPAPAKYAVKIADVERARDDVCHLWLRRLCPHGDECRFAHPADRGGPRPAGGEALAKKCLEFKKKGRCSRGDACPFRHVARAASGENRPPPEGPKPCFTFAKKGKCRKGAACKFAHV